MNNFVLIIIWLLIGFIASLLTMLEMSLKVWGFKFIRKKDVFYILVISGCGVITAIACFIFYLNRLKGKQTPKITTTPPIKEILWQENYKEKRNLRM